DSRDVHTGVVVEVRLGDRERHRAVAGTADERKADDRRGREPVRGYAVELALLTRREAAELGCPAGVVGRETELAALGRDRDGAGRGQTVAEGRAVVVGAKDQFELPRGGFLFFERDDELVRVVARFARLSDDERVLFV